MTPKKSALIKRRRRRFISASDKADIGNNSSVSESGSSSCSISSLSDDNSHEDDSDDKTDGADLDINRSIESEAATSSLQAPTTIDPPAHSQLFQEPDAKNVAPVAGLVSPAADGPRRFNSSNGWDRFPDVVNRNGQVDLEKIAGSKPRVIHYLNARKSIETGDYDGRQKQYRDSFRQADGGDKYRSGFRPQSLQSAKTRHENAPFIRNARWWSRPGQSPNYADIVTLLLQSPLYVKIPGDATSKIIKGYHRTLHSFAPEPILARRPMRIFLPDTKAKIVYPSAAAEKPTKSAPTDEIATTSAYSPASFDSNISQSPQPSVGIGLKTERPSTGSFTRNKKYTDVRLETGQQFQQYTTASGGLLEASNTERVDTSQRLEGSSIQPLVLPSNASQATVISTTQGQTGPVVSDKAQRRPRKSPFMSDVVRFGSEDRRQPSRSPHGGQFGTPRENVDYSHRPGANASDVLTKADSKDSENVPPQKQQHESASAVNSTLFEDDEPSLVPKVRLPPASVYSRADTSCRAESKSPKLPAAIESESAPSTVVPQQTVAPMQASAAPVTLPPQSAEPVTEGPIAALPTGPTIPKEYRLTPDVMHQPRPTKFVSVADIEPPVPQQSPVDGQQQRYTYAPRPRGFSNGYRGPRQDNSHGSHMPQYYYPSQTQDGKGMMRNIVPRAYAQGGYVSSMDGMSPAAYPPVVMPNGAILPVAAPSPQPVVTSVPSSTIAQETNGMVYFYDPLQYYQYYTESTATPPQAPPVVVPVVAPTQAVDGGIYYYPHVPQSTAYYQH
ncbi:hypothetical protein V1525DRAFT_401260 [Lipomyces kononenkoae]|uniref:Uncharacterized protein n=1 Tax=Lipomyces kononenkoae TaxID=34357 RepID=A0ACC3T3Y4_LIPKO